MNKRTSEKWGKQLLDNLEFDRLQDEIYIANQLQLTGMSRTEALKRAKTILEEKARSKA